MNRAMYKLDNVIQDYAWGSTNALTEFFGIENPQGKPQAELWMGAHRNGCSKLDDGKTLLSDLIQNAPEQVLGHYTNERYQELPFLLKVLAPEKPLSIQVHPEKSKAIEGFAHDNANGLALDAPNRNYRDDNHKPELVYALSPYRAMNGFRELEETIALFELANCPTLADDVAALKRNPVAKQLSAFFRAVLSLEGERKSQAIRELFENIDAKSAENELAREAFTQIKLFAKDYPSDVGLFAPLMLNLIELAPGEAMYLDAETPHAYIKGVGMEIMANSDNVLRAGLTPKHIDIDELIANTRFEPIAYQALRLAPQKQGDKLMFNVPVDDFKFEVLTASDKAKTEYVRSAEILFCMEGNITLQLEDETLMLKAGESAFIKELAQCYSYQGQGKIARAFN